MEKRAHPEFPETPWGDAPQNKATVAWREKSAYGRARINKSLGLPVSESIYTQNKWDAIDQLVETVFLDYPEVPPLDRIKLVYWLGRAQAIGAETSAERDAGVVNAVSSTLIQLLTTAAWTGALNLTEDKELRYLVVEVGTVHSLPVSDHNRLGCVPAKWPPDGPIQAGNVQTDLLSFLQGHNYQAGQQIVPLDTWPRSIAADTLASFCVILRALANISDPETSTDRVDTRVLDHLTFFESLYDHSHIDSHLLRRIGSEEDWKILAGVTEETPSGTSSVPLPPHRRKL